MADLAPIFSFKQSHQIGLNQKWIGVFGKSHAQSESTHMRVHNHAFLHVEYVAQHNIRGLARHATQREQCIHATRHLAIELLAHNAHAFAHRLGFVAPKVKRVYERLNLRGRGVGKIHCSWKFFKQRRCGFVHPNIGALSAQYGGNQQFMRLCPIQFAVRVWVSATESQVKSLGAGHGFGWLLFGVDRFHLQTW